MPFELLHPSWDVHRRVGALVTNRFGGVSEGSFSEFNLASHVGDCEQAVAENRAMLQAIVGPIQWLNQRHGREVFHATSRNPVSPPTADAVWTTVRGLVIGILTADCFPLFLTNRQGTLVGLAHCGWKPLVAGVVERLVRAIPCRPSDLIAWIGPGISQRNYQVGEDLVNTLRMSLGGSLLKGVLRDEHYRVHADLERLIRNQLQVLGVSVSEEKPSCTFEDGRFYSHRRDGPDTGRFASLIWLEAGPI